MVVIQQYIRQSPEGEYFFFYWFDESEGEDSPGDDAKTVLGSFHYQPYQSSYDKGRTPDLSIPDLSPEELDLIVAFYEYESYTGTAFLVYRDRRDGKVYEVEGGHCSCYGLEGQWDPQEVSIEEILNRPEFVETYGWSEKNKQQQNQMNEEIHRVLVSRLSPQGA